MVISDKPSKTLTQIICCLSWFNNIPKWMIDSFHNRKNPRKSFDNSDSYFSMISHVISSVAYVLHVAFRLNDSMKI